MFEDIRENIPNINALIPTTADAVQELQVEFPGIPRDYLTFLREIGTGNLGDIQIYGGPVRPNNVYPLIGAELKRVVLIGDDMQGYCFGFDIANGFRVVEVDPKGNVDPTIEPTFTELVRRYFS